MVLADRTHRQRGPFFDAVVELLGLPADAETLWVEYRRRMPDLAPAMIGVAAALKRLREQGVAASR